MSGPFSQTTAELARRLEAELQGSGDIRIQGLNTPAEAGPEDLTFIATAAYARQWRASRAAAAVVSRNVRTELEADGARPLLVVASVDVAMVRALEAFQRPEPVPEPGVHPTAWVHPEAVLGEGVRIGPHVSVERGVVLGTGVVLQAGVRLSERVKVGDGSILHANVAVRHDCVLGRRVILHQNVALGADGFGYRPSPDGRGLLKMPHIGNVVLEDDVEIGANSCVDRGKFGSTVIGAGTKIDNLCQIAHNIRIGRCCAIAACAAIGGSVVIGDGVLMGGGVGVSDHVTIGRGARIAGGSIVYSDVPDGATWMGIPAAESGAVKRQWVALKRLPELLRRLREKP